jgi:hypothetical protein
MGGISKIKDLGKNIDKINNPKIIRVFWKIQGFFRFSRSKNWSWETKLGLHTNLSKSVNADDDTWV